MEKISVTSSNIDSIGFDIENEILEITFLNGKTYQYDGVPKDEYLNLMGAESHGSYLSKGYPSLKAWGLPVLVYSKYLFSF